MSISETIFQRLLLAFSDPNKQSLKAASIIVNMGRLVPPSYAYPLPPPSTSEERLHFVCFVLKQETGITYSTNEVLVAHNVLMGNQRIQEELNLELGIHKIQQYLNEYKQFQTQSAFANKFSPNLILPHRTTCNVCNAQLKVIFHISAHVIYCTKIQPALLYKADCYNCRRSYRVSSVYSIDQKQTIVTNESQKSEYTHFSGSFVFSKEILVSFSAQLIHNYATFEGFAHATMETWSRLHVDHVDIITSSTLARSLQSVWIYFELANFVFMTSKSTEILFPFALWEGRTRIKGEHSSRAIFIERNINWIYHLFTCFWSHHEYLFGSCKTGNCSQVIIIDGHQKP